MRDPLPKGNYQQQSHTQTFASSGHPHNKRTGDNESFRRKSDYCWNFNKGVPCKFGNRCKCIERCSYCDSPSHPIINCNKAKKREANNSNGEANSSSSK